MLSQLHDSQNFSSKPLNSGCKSFSVLLISKKVILSKASMLFFFSISSCKIKYFRKTVDTKLMIIYIYQVFKISKVFKNQKNVRIIRLSTLIVCYNITRPLSATSFIVVDNESLCASRPVVPNLLDAISI